MQLLKRTIRGREQFFPSGAYKQQNEVGGQRVVSIQNPTHGAFMRRRRSKCPLGPPGGATIVSKWKAHLRAFLAPGHQCFRRRTGTGLNFVLRRRLAHAHQETEQQISPQQGEIASC